MNGTMRVSTALLAIVIGVAALGGTVGGYVLGSARSHLVSHLGVVVGSAENAISLEADGWTYSVPLDVTWIDTGGVTHEGGRPECLPPGAGPIEIAFHSVDVQIAGSGWRQVVYVDCRHAVPVP